MGAAQSVDDFHTRHAETVVGNDPNGIFIDRRPETRPALMRIVLGVGTENRSACGSTDIRAFLPEIVVLSGSRHLRTTITENIVLSGR